jgi:hypothetical protein
MCNEDKRHIEMWLSCCLTLTSVSWKTLTTVNAAIPSVPTKVHGLKTLFTSAESLKNVVYRAIQNFINFK